MSLGPRVEIYLDSRARRPALRLAGTANVDGEKGVLRLMADTHSADAQPYTLVGPDSRPYRSTAPGNLGGHRRARIYGRLDCSSARRAIARGGYVKHRVFFANEVSAIQARYRPCSVCLAQRIRPGSGRRVSFKPSRRRPT